MINTLEMMIGITFLLNFKWSDGRLDFHNLDSNGYNLISAAATSNLWLPSENIIHENAILGQIITDSQRIIGVTNLTSAMPIDTTSSIENYKFKGSNVQMFMSQRFKIIYCFILFVHPWHVGIYFFENYKTDIKGDPQTSFGILKSIFFQWHSGNNIKLPTLLNLNPIFQCTMEF